MYLALPAHLHMLNFSLQPAHGPPTCISSLRGDEDYIKRPENAFILFRRECCLRKNEAEAATVQGGDPVTRRQHQADLSKTISQQWRSLSVEERKYWDDLAKRRKKEHQEMYPWCVYQPIRSDNKKKKEGKKDKRDRTTSMSRIRCTGHDEHVFVCVDRGLGGLQPMSSDGSLYGAYGYANGTCGSVPEVEVVDLTNFDMSESEGQGQAQPQPLPLSFSMSGSGGSLAIDTRKLFA
ncbi:RFG1_1 [Sanghuangporus weigelae]